MKSLLKISIYSLLLLAFATSSCKEDDNLKEADRLFRPVGLTISTSSGIGVCDLIVKWDAMPGVKSYTIEFSEDSLLFENIIERFVTTSNEYVLAEQRRGKRISVRLRSNSDDMEHDSRFIGQTFLIPIENIFYPIQSGDVRATSITMRYQPGDLITHLLLINLETSDTATYVLSEADVNAGAYKMAGVSGSTDYRVEIYYGAEIRGQRTVTTSYAPKGENVVYLPAGISLKTVMSDTNNIGKILVLPESYVWTPDSTINIAGAMTIYGHPDGDRAQLHVGQFTLPSRPSAAIEFVYCNFDRYIDDGTGTVPENGISGTYMFNMSTAFGDIGKLSYTNCRIANYGRGFFRAQSSGTGVVDTMEINSCEFYNMGAANKDYGLFHLNVGGMAMTHFVIKNTTFNNIGCQFIYVAGTRNFGTKSVLMENCTLYNIMNHSSATTTRWFINLGEGGNPESSTITLKNLILGSTAPLNGAALQSGIKRFDNLTIMCEEVYQTTSWTVREGTAIDDAKPYNGTAADLFTDPTKGIFTIKDAAFAGKGTVGDPRWW